MKRTAKLVSVVITVALVAGLDAQGEKAKLPFKGTWQAVSLELDGEKCPTEAIKGLTYTFKGDKLTIAPAEPGANSEFTFATDATKKPKNIDLKITKGPGRGKTLSGIYEIDAKSLKICFAENRPTEFASKANTGVALVVLSRKSAK